MVPHLYELPSSLYVHSDGKKFDVITHIPLALENTRRNIYRRLDIPFILPSTPEDKDVANSRMTWRIPATTNYVVADENFQVVYEVTQRTIEECLNIGGDRYCKQIIRSRDGVHNS